MDVEILLYDGFDDLDAVGPYEVLSMAADAGAPLAVRLVTRVSDELVTSSHGLAIIPHGVVSAAADLLVVPGGSWAARTAVGAWGEIARGALPALLAAEHARGAMLASVCTGTMLLAAAGLTRGRPATTHHLALDALRADGADVIAVRVVDDGDLVTAGGVTSGIDMALWLVERHFGHDRATAVATRIEHDRRGEVHLGPGAARIRQ